MNNYEKEFSNLLETVAKSSLPIVLECNKESVQSDVLDEILDFNPDRIVFTFKEDAKNIDKIVNELDNQAFPSCIFLTKLRSGASWNEFFDAHYLVRIHITTAQEPRIEVKLVKSEKENVFGITLKADEFLLLIERDIKDSSIVFRTADKSNLNVRSVTDSKSLDSAELLILKTATFKQQLNQLSTNSELNLGHVIVFDLMDLDYDIFMQSIEVINKAINRKDWLNNTGLYVVVIIDQSQLVGLGNLSWEKPVKLSSYARINLRQG